MLKVFEAFSGVGTQRKALSNKGIPHEVVGIAEIDEEAVLSYEAIHGKTKNYGDISKLDVNELPDHDLFTYSFPCQDISLAGKKSGLEEGSETRSSLLWECKKVIEGKKPKYLLLENVKNLVGKKNISAFKSWLSYLETQGYTNYTPNEKHWNNALDFGIPQNRERVFVFSILGGTEEDFKFPQGKGHYPSLETFLEPNDQVDPKYFKSKEALMKIDKWKSFQNPLERIVGRKGHSPTLTRRGAGLNHSGQILISTADHNMNIRGRLDEVDLESLEIRNVTPREAWRLTGFTDDDFEKARAVHPEKKADKILYEQVGNAIVIQVLEAIFEEAFSCKHSNLEDGWYASNPPKKRCLDCGDYLRESQL
jgi:DNA (cytosine-5)-methyltransferase 1